MEEVELALIVALDEEYQTIRRTLGISPTDSVDRIHAFSLPHLADTGQASRMVVHVTGEMGLLPTASATDMVLSRFRPKWLVSIGLSGQLNGDCALGDVVLATDCDLAYSEARRSIDRTEFAGKTYEVEGLRGFLSAVDLSKYLQGMELQIPGIGKKELEEKRLWRRYPRVHAGIVCSTDFLVDDPRSKSELLQRNRRFLCTDMESAAMVSAARKCGFAGQLAIIRAVSDPADGTKKAIDRLAGSGVIRRYAMRNAATLLQHAVIAPLVDGREARRYADRPIVIEAIARLRKVDGLLSSRQPSEAVAAIDADLQWAARDAEIAKFVYRARILKSLAEVPKPLAREVAAMAAGPAVNFYVALHVMQSLSSEFEKMPELLIPLTHVHTFEVNQFCKALLDSAKKSGHLSRLLSRMSVAYDAAAKAEMDPAARSNLQAHLCYLLGRVSDEQLRPRATETLERWRDRLIASASEKKRTTSSGRRALGVSVATLEALIREQLLQYRTIQISLVQLGGQDESDRYILSCLASSRLDAQNRGFHLEYYGDTPYDPEQPLSNEDSLAAIPKTLRTLGEKLLTAFRSGGKYPLRDIELYTVISLLRSRLQECVLSAEDRVRGLQILSEAFWMSTNEKLQMLLGRVTFDLANPSFHPAGIVEDIYRLKKLRRTGWTARGRNVADPESVGSHTFGGLALIELFLPETKSSDARQFGAQYSKERVLRLFLKHDWAEAIIGDLLPDQKTEEAGVREEAAFKKLGLSFIYSPYANRTIYEDWLDFERGTSINSELARDVDQLDCLQQLLIESEASPTSIPDRSTWIDWIRDRVRTEWGRQMFAFLLKRDR